MAGPEKKIEDYLVRECKKLGGIAEKFTSPNKIGVPDRLCQFPYNIIIFVELKAEGKKPTLKQKLDHESRRKRGHTVLVIDSKAGVDKFINEVNEAIEALRNLEEAM